VDRRHIDLALLGKIFPTPGIMIQLSGFGLMATGIILLPGP